MNKVKAGTFWKHDKTGRIYLVLLIANSQGDDPSKEVKYPKAVVYKGSDGKTWTRPLSDWHRSMTFLPNDNEI